MMAARRPRETRDTLAIVLLDPSGDDLQGRAPSCHWYARTVALRGQGHMLADRGISLRAATLLVGLLATCGCGLSTGGTLSLALDATTGSNSCIPGQQSVCACPGSATPGAQTCNSDGHSLGACMGCGAGDGAPSARDDTSDAGGATGDAAAGAGATGDAAAGGGTTRDAAMRDAASLEAASREGGGFNCDPPEGGPPCDPGHVPCGGSSCPTSTSFCCQTLTGLAGTCDQTGSTCTQGASLHCDEAADCDAGVCCLSPIGAAGATVTATCQATCPSGTFQLCRSNRECLSGQPCIAQTCLGGSDEEACSIVTGCSAK
jgi:hypothetical protein